VDTQTGRGRRFCGCRQAVRKRCLIYATCSRAGLKIVCYLSGLLRQPAVLPSQTAKYLALLKLIPYPLMVQENQGLVSGMCMHARLRADLLQGLICWLQPLLGLHNVTRWSACSLYICHEVTSASHNEHITCLGIQPFFVGQLVHASKIRCFCCVGRRLSAMRGLRRRHLARGLVKLAQSKLSQAPLASRFC